MESEGDSAQRATILASFDSRRAAEHMLASLGRKFREKARKEGVDAFIVRGNSDGSLKLTQSRVLTAGGITSALVHVSFSLTVGFWGTVSMFKGLWRSGHAAHVRESHVGSDDRTAHAILAKAGPNAAIALICCKDRETRKTVAARAAERSSYCWDGSRTEFLADLDPGPKHDWVRTALGEPSGEKH
jgi:hypothetical protein